MAESAGKTKAYIMETNRTLEDQAHDDIDYHLERCEILTNHELQDLEGAKAHMLQALGILKSEFKRLEL